MQAACKLAMQVLLLLLLQLIRVPSLVNRCRLVYDKDEPQTVSLARYNSGNASSNTAAV
jgi:hypothetical protein